MGVTDYQDESSIGARQPTPEPTATMSPEDAAIVEGLRKGRDASFAALIDLHHGSMLRVAGLYVADGAAAEDVVQETWMAVIRGIDRFDGRSSIKTWIFRILTNRAKTMGERASRIVPISSLVGGPEPAERAVDPTRFFDTRHPQWPGHWCSPPASWTLGPEDRVATREAVDVVLGAIALLPPAQREVITLRDIECWTSKEVCNKLSLTETNQRVLLHRARSKVRLRLEEHYDAS